MRATLVLLVAALQASSAQAPRPRTGPLVLAAEGGIVLEAAPARSVVPRSWLAAGDVLRLEQGARVVLVYRSGQRFEALGQGRVRVGADAATGPTVRKLPALPRWPIHVRAAEVRSTRPGGVRVRAGRIEGLRPAEGEALRADQAWLGFTPEPGALAHAIELRDAQGRLVFATRATAQAVPIPEDRLAPGAWYYWTVETVDAVGPGAQGEASFRTLSAEEVRALDETSERLKASPEPDARVYLAAIEAGLGLPAKP